MAAEMSEFTKNQILLQAGTAMLAQANQAPTAVRTIAHQYQGIISLGTSTSGDRMARGAEGVPRHPNSIRVREARGGTAVPAA